MKDDNPFTHTLVGVNPHQWSEVLWPVNHYTTETHFQKNLNRNEEVIRNTIHRVHQYFKILISVNI